jgi:PilZ domain
MRFLRHVRRALGDRPGLTAKERRRFERFEVGSNIKIYVRQETCTGEIVNISPIGAMIKAPCQVAYDEPITIEHEAAGRVDGKVARIFPGGFAIKYEPSRLSVEFTLASLRTRAS